MTCYAAADKSADRFVKNYAYFMTGALLSLIFGPATFVLYHYLNGALTREMMRLPVDAL